MLIGERVSGAVVRVIGSVGVLGGRPDEESVCVDDESVGVVENERPVDIGEGRIAGRKTMMVVVSEVSYQTQTYLS